MVLVAILLGFITAVGVVYISVLQRQILEDQKKQIAIQQEFVKNLQELLKRGDAP